MLRRILAPASIAFALSLFSTTGAAMTAQRTFVASTGSDVDPCSIAAPCRGFARAITQTSAGGEVVVLDSAGYGSVTVTKSVSIIAPAGIYAGISVLSGDGVTVNAPGATVVLHGLSINGQGGDRGVSLLAAARLRVENCVVSGMGHRYASQRQDRASRYKRVLMNSTPEPVATPNTLSPAPSRPPPLCTTCTSSG